MEKLHFNMVLLPLIFLLQLPHLLFLSSSANYTLPDKYFINCGSNSNITVGDRNFLGDMNSGSSFSFAPSVSVTNASTHTPLYQTARIFRNPSSYEFDISDNGVYYVRIHFFPFMSPTTNLADAVFNVSVSGFSLLSNFSIPSSSNSPVIKEFLLTINGGKFRVYFTPKSKSFAFVNAIEVFLTPESFGKDNFTHVTPLGSNDSYLGVRSQVLQTIHRINVGGPQINNDSLWRNWIPDDGYLLSVGSAKNCVPYNGTLNYYDRLGGTNYSASDLVYKTCKELNLVSNPSNITWRFNVSKNARHLVRLHFCDIISTQPDFLRFNLYIYSNFGELIYPYSRTKLLAAPFYFDRVVDSDDSGFMNISVGSREDSKNKNAYLNGLEIMEFMKESDMVTMHSGPKKRLFVIVGSVGGVVLFFILVILFLLGLKWKKKTKQVDGVGSLPVLLHGHGRGIHSKGTANVPPARKLNLNLKISLVEILEATDNFDTKLLVGEGGFGKVYKGRLQSGIKVAVKRSDPKHGQGIQEFETEIIVLSKIRHRHLVSLIGYCDEGSEMILVYEFMEKGTLRDHLYNANENSDRTVSKLSWNQRLEICIASAKGLHYLHTCSLGGIIHRDVKSTNILLNEDFMAKVADFGLSTPGPLDPDHFSIGIKGSFGYLDPEYFRTFQFTEKSDVYSFGVVLLEVLCARPAIIDSPTREEVNLADWGMFWQKKGQLEKIIDPLLVDEINPDSLRKFGETAEKCLKGNGDERPTMVDVQWDLEYALQLQKTAVNREALEDSTTNAFLEYPLPLLGRLASNSILNVEDDDNVPLKGEDDLDTTERAVFSQMRVDGAR